MHERETLEPLEYAMAGKPEDRRAAEISISASAAVESLAKRHEELFAAAEKFLPMALRERLRAKASRDRELLKQSFEREQQIVQAARKAVHVLNAAFFRIIRMEPHIFD